MPNYPINSSAAGAHIGLDAPQNKVPKGYKTAQVPRLTGEQLRLFHDFFGLAAPEGSLYKRAMGDLEGFEPQETTAKRDFQQALGGMGSRFAGLGTGAMQSSAFQHAGTQAGEDFATKLAQQRQKYQREALSDLLDVYGALMGTQPYQQFLVKKDKKPGFWSQIGSGLTEGLFGGLGSYLKGGF